MSVYLIVTGNPKDPEKLAKYSQSAGPTMAAAGAKMVAKGKPTALTGEPSPLAAIFTFPDRAAVEAWYASADYQALVDLREQAMDTTFMVLET